MGGTAVGLQGNAGTSPEPQPEGHAKALGANWKPFLFSAVLVVAAFAIYYPVHNYSFLLGIDDGAYVYDNAHILHPLNWTEIKWAFTHTYCANYDPLTFLAHSIDVRMFQLNAGWHHEVNVVLHALDAVLLFWVLKRATGFTGRSFMVAALFAVHPINVENVAWISELKTMLSTAFFLLALGAYHWYARKPELRRMLGVGFLFGLGLLAKPQVITLPFVLLLWDYWPLRRMFAGAPQVSSDTRSREIFPPAKFSALVMEKVPLFFIAAVDVLLTLHSETKPDLERYTFLIRLGTAFHSYAVYLGKTFWPIGLAFDYPHPGYALRWGEVWAAMLLLLAITALVVVHRQHRYLLVGWLWFVGTMVPTINLVQIDIPAVADRYAYICFIGLFVIVCWGAAEFAQRRHFSRLALPAVSAVVLVALSAVSRYQVQYWSDAFTVWTRSLQVAPNNWVAEALVGRHLAGMGRVEEGLGHLSRALEHRPRDPFILMTMAVTEHQRGNLRKAILYYQQALVFSQDDKVNAQMLANMGHAYSDLGDSAHALECYRRAQRLQSASLNGGR